jgi:HEAT repeat protein
MSKNNKRRGTNAEELMRRLMRDPEYVAQLNEKKRQSEENAERHDRIAAPIIEGLQDAGYHVDSLDVLCQSGARYASAIPILIKWLPKISDANVKESIVRALSVPWAKPTAAKPLIQEFRNAPDTANSGLKWAIGNALSIVADDSVLSDLCELLRDKSHGGSREMLAVALGNMKDPVVVDSLIELLNDEEVAGHALMGLRKLKAQKARPYIEPFLNHSKSWVRKEASKALAKLSK